jgi:hypothetical protein
MSGKDTDKARAPVGPDAAADYQRQRLQEGRECLEAALAYLGRGIAVLAVCPPDHVGVGKSHGKVCDSPGKAPLVKWAEFQDRLPTEAEVRSWWERWQNANVGAALGPVSGLIRGDVDGPGGERQLRDLSGGDLPDTWEFTSGRENRGRGLLYAIPPGVRLRTTARQPRPGEELRFQAKGAQTVLPPSRHPSGTRYSWVPGHGPDDTKPALAPAWLVEHLREPDPATAPGGRPHEPSPDGDARADRATVLSALAALSNDDRIYDEWLAVGMVLHDVDPGEDMLEEWVRWSKRSGKHRPGVCEKKWASFGRRPDGTDPETGRPYRVATPTLYRWARADGWARAKNGQGDGAGQDPRGRDPAPRPVVLLGTDEHRVNDEAVAALADPQAAPEVFQRGNALVTVLRPAVPPKTGAIDRPPGTPRIAPLVPAQLRETLSRVADFRKPVVRKGRAETVSAHPPDWCVAGVHARGHWHGVRTLEAVVEAPTLRPDGSVLGAPGWDPWTGLLYEPNGDYPAVPRSPAHAQADEAVGVFLDLVHDFPFLTAEDRAAWLAALLTALARAGLDGPCPLFLIDANAPGTGKTMLLDSIALIATGRPMSRTSFPEADEELRKRITAVAIAGDRLVAFDNITGAFGGAALDAALTGTVWRDRLLGRSEMTPELPLHAVWYATGNNVTLRGDVRRRVVPCRLETAEEKPEERTGFAYPDLLGHVRRHRGELVAAGLTILRAYVVAGRPVRGLAPFGSFENWSGLVRAAVFWATDGLDPCATRARLRDADPALATLVALLEGWPELPDADKGLTVAEALDILKAEANKGKYQTLRGAFMEWSKGDRLPAPGQVGRKLRNYRGRVANGKALEGESAGGGVQRWKVVSKAETEA